MAVGTYSYCTYISGSLRFTVHFLQNANPNNREHMCESGKSILDTTWACNGWRGHLQILHGLVQRGRPLRERAQRGCAWLGHA